MITALIVLVIVILFVLPTLKDRVIRVKKLLIIPALFLYLLYDTLTSKFAIDSTAIVLIILAGIVGFGIGVYLRRATAVTADRNKELIWIPGGWLSLWTFLLIFVVQFATGYLHAVNPAYLLQNSAGEQSLMFILSLVSCITVGANLCLYYKYLNTKQVANLEQSNASILGQLLTRQHRKS